MRRILLCLAHMSGQEMKYIEEAFADNWVVPLGPNVEGFEKDLQKFLKSGPVVALSAGTAAVHLALVLCGVQPGDEVMCQTFTFSASCNPIKYLGANPVFVDSEPQTWNMDPALLDDAIADRIAKTGRTPKAIVAVHLYGMPAKMAEINAVADKYGIPVIEDAAEGMGSVYRGRACGTWGKLGVLSFNGNKMITTSGGGALVCPDEETAKRAMFYATQAREAYPYYQHEEIGYNYRMSNICAGIGRGQMTILEEHIAHHRMLHNIYAEAFAGVKDIELHGNPNADFDSNFWLNTITIAPEVHVEGEEKAYSEAVTGAVGGAAGVTRKAKSLHTAVEPNRNVETLRLALQSEGIESRPLWKPMHLQPVYASAPAYTNGVSESLFPQGLCLPSGPWVTPDDARYIAARIIELSRE